MNIPRIYLDTSVVGGCCDAGFADASRAVIELFVSGQALLIFSSLLATELERAPADVQAWALKVPAAFAERVESTAEAEALRDLYLAAGVVGPASLLDAHHVAIATVARADMIVSWNFKHIVHHEKMAGFNAVNLREGYPALRIFSPLEVV